MSLGQLALHIATVPGGVAQMAAQPSMQMPAFNQPPATDVSELVPALENSVKQAKAALGGMNDAAMAETWKVLDGTREVMAMPRGAFLRSIMLNHWYHHRGQLWRLSEVVERAGAVGLRAHRRREPVRGTAGRRSAVNSPHDDVRGVMQDAEFRRQTVSALQFCILHSAS